MVQVRARQEVGADHLQAVTAPRDLSVPNIRAAVSILP
jgi:hypothetical protein